MRPYEAQALHPLGAIIGTTFGIRFNYGEQAALSFFKIATGEGTPLRDLVDAWLDEQAGDITAQNGCATCVPAMRLDQGHAGVMGPMLRHVRCRWKRT